MAPSMQRRVTVVQGDITRITADAIVNAANSELQAGSGVCGAIFRAAGCDQLRQACESIGRCQTGEAVITPAFAIKTAKHIVHAVGPIYVRYTPEEARRLLRSAYVGAIRTAAAAGCKTIAFPAISTGVYGYPLKDACREAVEACAAAAQQADVTVILVAFDSATADMLRHFVETAA